MSTPPFPERFLYQFLVWINDLALNLLGCLILAVVLAMSHVETSMYSVLLLIPGGAIIWEVLFKKSLGSQLAGYTFSTHEGKNPEIWRQLLLSVYRHVGGLALTVAAFMASNICVQLGWVYNNLGLQLPLLALGLNTLGALGQMGVQKSVGIKVQYDRASFSIKLLPIPLLLFAGAVNLTQSIPDHSRQKESTVKANMYTLQTMVETYYLDHGIYPNSVGELTQAAQKEPHPYWKPLRNPYLSYQSQDNERQKALKNEQDAKIINRPWYDFWSGDAPKREPGTITYKVKDGGKRYLIMGYGNAGIRIHTLSEVK